MQQAATATTVSIGLMGDPGQEQTNSKLCGWNDASVSPKRWCVLRLGLASHLKMRNVG
jgi:hypothetical protein